MLWLLSCIRSVLCSFCRMVFLTSRHGQLLISPIAGEGAGNPRLIWHCCFAGEMKVYAHYCHRVHMCTEKRLRSSVLKFVTLVGSNSNIAWCCATNRQLLLFTSGSAGSNHPTCILFPLDHLRVAALFEALLLRLWATSLQCICSLDVLCATPYRASSSPGLQVPMPTAWMK